MKRANFLMIVFLSTMLVMSMFSFVHAETKRITKPRIGVTDIANGNFSGYNVTANTTDGGKVVFLFIWQRKISWNYTGEKFEFLFDTPPILQMSKYLPNGTLDSSITYIPLFLLQYNDTDGNGVFDFWTVNHEEFEEEIGDDEIEWQNLSDKPYKIYSLAPILNFGQGVSWNWTVSPLKQENVTINNVQTYQYSWNISATVPSLPWMHEFDDESEGHKTTENTTIHVYLGYHIQLLPENPVVKYDFNLSDITWKKDENSTKLAMMSAVLYYSQESPIICFEDKHLQGFNETTECEETKFTISENATKAVKAFISYSPNATLDGVNQADVIKTALQPLFLIPTPVLAPEGLYVRGTYPGMEGRRTWKHYIAFAHQLGIPHFQTSAAQDPTIGLANAGLQVVPEFQSLIPMLLTLVTVTVWMVALKRRQLRLHQQNKHSVK